MTMTLSWMGHTARSDSSLLATVRLGGVGDDRGVVYLSVRTVTPGWGVFLRMKPRVKMWWAT